MWVVVALGSIIGLLVSWSYLEAARGRERKLAEELAHAESEVRQCQAQALQARAEVQQANVAMQQLQADAQRANAWAQQERTDADLARSRAQDARNEAEQAREKAQVAEAQAKLDRASAQQAQAEAERIQAAINELADVERRYRGVLDLEGDIQKLEGSRRELRTSQKELRENVQRLRHELAALTDEEYFVDFGIYDTRYDFPTSESYKGALDSLRERQKKMVKDGTAAVCHVPWTVEGSKTKGKKMTADNLKLMIRAFNGECDAAIAKATYKNVGVIEQRIWKAKDQIDRLNAVNRCELTQAYAELKVEELRLFHEYALKKEEERQEQRELQEQIREERKAQQELEKVRKQAEEEEARYAAALAKAREEADKVAGDKHTKMVEKIAELEARLLEAQTNKERAISQAQITRAGHVYVISNIGSFGEDVYKIGMTRRLDPMERVKELGDASVPFSFDVHAIIRSQDAPTLERELHRRFTHRRLNLINERKEFFGATLQEISTAVTELHGEIELTKVAEAAEYRQTLALRHERATQHEGTMGMVRKSRVAPQDASTSMS